MKLAIELEAFHIADKQSDKSSNVRNFAISEDSRFSFSDQIKQLPNTVEQLRSEINFIKLKGSGK